MPNHKDSWHWPRPDLAASYLERFEPGPAQALSLFAERRSGKTDFLVKDLAPAAEKAGLQPVYVDLWSNRNDPGKALADSLETATRMLRDPKFKAGRLAGSMEQLTNVGVSGLFGAVGVTLGRTRRPEDPAPTDKVSRIGFWGHHLCAATTRPVLLMVDEVQALAYVSDGVDVSSALRSVLQQQGRMKLRPVFTGSSRDGLQRMFNRYQAAFFRYGSQDNFPSPGESFVDFLATKAKEASGIELDAGALREAYAEFNHKPGPIREMVEMMANDRSEDVAKYTQRELGILLIEEKAKMDLASLRPLERAVLEAVMLHGKVYTKEAKAHIGEHLGVDESAINNKSLAAATDKLRANGMIVMIERGEYRIEDSELANHIEERFEEDALRRAPKLGRLDREAQYVYLHDDTHKGADAAVRDAAALVWVRDPTEAVKKWPALAGTFSTATHMLQEATGALRKQNVDPATIEIASKALQQRLAQDIAKGKLAEAVPINEQTQGPER